MTGLELSFWLPLLLFVPLILAQGFFAGSELALISCNRAKIQQLTQRGDKRAIDVQHFFDHPEQFLACTLIGNNLAGLGNMSLVTWFLIEHQVSQMRDEVFILLFCTPLLLVFGELVPKSYFQHHANSMALRVSPLIRTMSKILFPFMALFKLYTIFLNRILGANRETSKSVSREDLKRLILETEHFADIHEDETRLVSKILAFGEGQISDVLVPLIHVQGIEAQTKLPEIVDYLVEVEHSRVPVYDERIDKIIGVIHSFDLISVKDTNASAKELMRDTIFVPPSLRLDRCFDQMRRKGISMAIVVNEYGGAEGIATIEDVVEHVLGDIDDEFDAEEIRIQKSGAQSYSVAGWTPIDEFNEILGCDIPKEEDYDTVAGFLLKKFQRVPRRFEFTNTDGVQFTITECTERSIERIHVRLIPTHIS